MNDPILTRIHGMLQRAEADPTGIEVRPSKARARLTVFNADGSIDKETDWGPWELMTTNWGRILQGIFQFNAGNVSEQYTLTDTGAVGRTVRIRSSAAAFFMDNTGSVPTRLGFGNGAGTPAIGDTEISGALISAFAAQARTNNEAARTITIAGATVYGGGNTNVTRVGIYLLGFDTGNTERTFLIDHSTVATTSITTGQSVGVTYQISY